MSADTSSRGQTRATLALLARAHYPYVYAVSQEDERVAELVVEVGAELRRRVFVWSSVYGLVAADAPRELRSSPATLWDALTKIEAHDEPGFYIVLDAHRHLCGVELIRRLCDLAPVFEQASKQLVLIGESDAVPADLREDFAVVDVPLPDVEELLGVLREVLRKDADLSEDDLRTLAVAARGLTLREARRAFRRARVHEWRLDLGDVAQIVAEKERHVPKLPALRFYPPGAGLDSIGGHDGLKEWLRARGRAFLSAAAGSGSAPRGLLLTGVPGCGKSATCLAIAGEWRLPLLRLDLASLIAAAHRPADEILAVVETVYKVAPCVVWIDDVERIIASPKGGFGPLLSALMSRIEESRWPVFVAATANRIDALSGEAVGQLRTDGVFFVDLPNQNERQEIFDVHLRSCGADPTKFDVAAASQRLDGSSGSAIASVVRSAHHDAMADGVELVSDHLQRALDEHIGHGNVTREELTALRDWARAHARPAGA